MGSGRGKNRRAQTSAACYPDDAVWAAQWVNFVETQDLLTTKLSDYYNIPFASQDDSARRGGHAQLSQEVFRDLISIGAVALPTAKKAEDVSFSVEDTSSVSPNNVHYALFMKTKNVLGEEHREIVLHHPEHFFHDTMRMGGHSMRALLSLIRSSSQTLLWGICPSCDGRGIASDGATTPKPCTQCGATGRV